MARGVPHSCMKCVSCVSVSAFLDFHCRSDRHRSVCLLCATSTKTPLDISRRPLCRRDAASLPSSPVVSKRKLLDTAALLSVSSQSCLRRTAFRARFSVHLSTRTLCYIFSVVIAGIEIDLAANVQTPRFNGQISSLPFRPESFPALSLSFLGRTLSWAGC